MGLLIRCSPGDKAAPAGGLDRANPSRPPSLGRYADGIAACPTYPPKRPAIHGQLQREGKGSARQL